MGLSNLTLKRGGKILRKAKSIHSKQIFILLVILLAMSLVFYIKNIKTKSDYIPKCPDCNIIIINPTNIGAKHMSLYGYSRDTTPNINKFAKGSIVFTNAFSPISWSLPAVASLFTSEYPFTHGLMGRNVLDQKEVTLAEILKLYNYTTIAFTGGGDYKSIYGINQGFDLFDDDNKSIIFTGSFNRTLPLGIDWIRKNRDKKFFMFLQGYDAHCPFDPPQEFASLYESGYSGNLKESVCIRNNGNPYDSKINITNYPIPAFYWENMTLSPSYAVLVPVNLTHTDIEHLISYYDSEIKYSDYLVGEFLMNIEKMGVLKNTVVIIVGDHGETFGEHGNLIRLGFVRGTLYDEIIHIPLVMKHPLIKSNKRIDALTQTIDVMPTILDFLGIPINHEVQGKSLLPLINGSDKSIHQYVFSGGRFGRWKSEIFPFTTLHDIIRSQKWKLVFERSTTGEIFAFELYDIETDPNEKNNLIVQEPEIARELKEELQRWEKRTILTKRLKEVNLTDEELMAAREAGYLG